MTKSYMKAWKSQQSTKNRHQKSSSFCKEAAKLLAQQRISRQANTWSLSLLSCQKTSQVHTTLSRWAKTDRNMIFKSPTKSKCLLIRTWSTTKVSRNASAASMNSRSESSYSQTTRSRKMSNNSSSRIRSRRFSRLRPFCSRCFREMPAIKTWCKNWRIKMTASSMNNFWSTSQTEVSPSRIRLGRQPTCFRSNEVVCRKFFAAVDPSVIQSMSMHSWPNPFISLTKRLSLILISTIQIILALLMTFR